MATMHNARTGQSLAVDVSQTECNALAAGDVKEKKRGKPLMRCEAVRDVSPPNDLDVINKNTNLLSVSNANTKTQIGPPFNSKNGKFKSKQQDSSQGSLESSSPCLSRDSSTENYTDFTGTDLQQFLVNTLEKNYKDRPLLLKIEHELTQLVKDSNRQSHKFPQMTSYNRMLVHRVAAFFGLEHNVDGQGSSVLVNKTKCTRIPELKFKDHIKDEPSLLEVNAPKKSILKRDSASLEDSNTQSSLDGKERSPDRQNGSLSDSSRSKSLEEREAHYEKARARIFNQDSSTEQSSADESSNFVILNINNSNNSGNSIISQSNSSPRSSSQEDDLPSNSENEHKQWNSTDSDNSGRPASDANDGNVKLLLSNANVESETAPKPETSALLTPSCSSANSVNVSQTVVCNSQTASKPYIKKANSFGGISLTPNANYNYNSNNTFQSRHKYVNSLTPKINARENAHNSAHNSTHQQKQHNNHSHQQNNQHNSHHSQHNNQYNVVHHNQYHSQHSQQHSQHHNSNQYGNQHTHRASHPQQPQQRFVVPHHNNHNQNQPTVNASHNGRQTWQQLRHPNEHMIPVANMMGWPQVVQNNYQPFLATQPSNGMHYGTVAAPLATPTQRPLPSHVNQVPFQLSTPPQNSINFAPNTPQNIHRNSNGYNPIVTPPPQLNHAYGAPVQLPVWIVGNGIQAPSSGAPSVMIPNINNGYLRFYNIFLNRS